MFRVWAAIVIVFTIGVLPAQAQSTFDSIVGVVYDPSQQLVPGAAAQKASVPKKQDQLALGEDEVKQLLLLIDTQNRGKITKQQWMNFMEAEFERLDKNRSGELDIAELAQSRLRVSPFAKAGK